MASCLHTHPPRASRRRQRGLTLIELMVSITIGMFLVAAIGTLIASQSGNRAEVDRAGRLIDNGRYSVQAMSDDLQMAGYWGELDAAPVDAPIPAPAPDVCSLLLADQKMLSQLHVQGFDSPVAADVPGCVRHHQPETDILVVRHAEPDTSGLQTATVPPVPDMTKLVAGQLYIQTGLNVAAANFEAITDFASTTPEANSATFTLKKKDRTTRATVRRVAVRIYYIARCSVESGGGCDAGDGGNPIPTLKMIELVAKDGAAAWTLPVTIAEGIENMQVDYGVDTDKDGVPNDVDVTNVASPEGWKNVVAVKIHMLARALETSPGQQDNKTYNLGLGATFTPPSGPQQAYKRHVFVQSVRLVNPAARRQS